MNESLISQRSCYLANIKNEDLDRIVEELKSLHAYMHDILKTGE